MSLENSAAAVKTLQTLKRSMQSVPGPSRRATTNTGGSPDEAEAEGTDATESDVPESSLSESEESDVDVSELVEEEEQEEEPGGAEGEGAGKNRAQKGQGACRERLMRRPVKKPFHHQRIQAERSESVTCLVRRCEASRQNKSQKDEAGPHRANLRKAYVR